jgi:membrane dipeptidase
MRHLSIPVVFWLATSAGVALAGDREPIVLSDEALDLHRSCLVFDGHNDLPWTLREKAESSFDKMDIAKSQPDIHTDIARLREGGLGAEFWSVYVPVDSPDATRETLEQIDIVYQLAHRYPMDFELAFTAADIERIHGEGRIASLIGMEGGHSIENSLGTLRMLYQLGARYMTLTHSDALDWADAATDDPRSDGLSEFGEEVVRAMNELGMLVDISHVSVATMEDALRVSKAPIIASHSCADAIAHHPRNVPDHILEGVRANRGVVMVNFASGFLVPESAAIWIDAFDVWRAIRKAHEGDEEAQNAAWELWAAENPIDHGTIHDLLDHIDHIVKIAGVDHVGLGSDYDGITELPAQLEDVSSYPYITQGLLNRGYGEQDIRKILGLNALRALREAERVAAELTSGS